MSGGPSAQETFNATTAQISSAFSQFTASLKPLGQQVGRGFVQAQQLAKEKEEDDDALAAGGAEAKDEAGASTD